ncbi:YeeE/YedE family protein [Luteibacter aegosomatis]|uniref:YeeE/YedE family protein n=1 Tax=Luteibacter aegosomatis TaxID=2911537 RepID=UPI001FF84FDC|nr:YeeE/YedE family protein [Luteibacter aegosomatis]UPG83899.1 YeeE/YedE family protein [Luteibacter aegosomatis]
MNRRHVLRIVTALSAGLVFGFGLSLSGMVDPSRVLGFLDVASAHWNPSLLYVLGAADTVAILGIWLQRHRAHPVLDTEFHLPSHRVIDRRLLGGSALFGVGWGLAGLCPGPAVATLAVGLVPTAIFVVAMAGGMLCYEWLDPTPSR